MPTVYVVIVITADELPFGVFSTVEKAKEAAVKAKETHDCQVVKIIPYATDSLADDAWARMGDGVTL